MTGKFIITFGIFLTLLVLICIIVVTVTNGKIKTDSENALFSQVETHTSRILEGSSKLLEESLRTTLEGVVRIYSNIMADTYRPNYSMGFSSSYFDYNNSYLAPPLTQDSRQTMPVSLSNSAYYVPGSVPNDILGFSLAIQTVRDQSQNQDPFFRTLYNEYTNFVALYSGFEDDGLFRIYPGSPVDINRSYDPRARGWYTETKTINTFTITSPYQDFAGRGWMITITSLVNNSVTDQLVGVSGGDMLISTLSDNIQKIQLLETGKLTLFERSGIVVADREWNLDATVSVPLQYSDLQNPAVTAEIWTWISGIPVGQTRTATFVTGGNEWLITASGQSEMFSKYIMVAFILKSEVTASMTEIVNQINTINIAIPLGILFGSILLGLLTILWVYFMSKKISKPFDDSRNNILMLQQNFGKDDLTEGLSDLDGGMGTEQQQFKESVGRVIQSTRDMREPEPIQNNCFGNNNPYIISYGSGNESHIYYQASAPSLDILTNANELHINAKGKHEL
jgi:hypothetical protein